MISTRNQSSFHVQPKSYSLLATLALVIAMAPFLTAQAPLASNPVAGIIAASTRLNIPDSPGFLFSSSSSSADPDSASFDSAPKPVFKHSLHLHMIVLPGEIADPMAVRDKVQGGLTNSVSLFAATGWLAAAGWGHLIDDSPNYGTDSGAFGQRLGAAAILGISNGVFSNSLFASMFHEDPRYYVLGPGRPILKRLIYAGTRCIITRTDSGRSTPNFALLAGNAAGSALTVTYYPAKNTTFSEVAETFGSSLGGAALGFVVDEFIVDPLVDLHLKKKRQQP